MTRLVITERLTIGRAVLRAPHQRALPQLYLSQIRDILLEDGVPETRIVFYRTADGTVPVLEWLIALQNTHPRAYAKCVAAMFRLRDLGHELRRPEADTLRSGISELRVKFGHVHYRLLYAIHNRTTAVLAHALTKEDRIPVQDIDLAVARIKAFARNAAQHTYVWEGIIHDTETR